MQADEAVLGWSIFALPTMRSPSTATTVRPGGVSIHSGRAASRDSPSG
jgi:hypothetical protein